MAYFAGNPILATVSCGTFPSDSSNRRIVLRVTIGTHVYVFYHSAESGQSNIVVDVSSAYRAELMSAGYPTPTNPSSSSVTGTCTVVGECVVDGYVTTISSGFSVSGGSVTARHGGYSEIDRISGTSEAPSVLSTKPTTSAEVVGVGEVVMCGNNKIESAVYGAQTFNGRSVYGDNNNHCHTMYFINRYGEVETASIVTMESLSVSISSETVSQVRGPQSASYAKSRIYKTGGNNSWKMSSGYLEREWLEWFAHDFVMSKFHWLTTNKGIIPVTVSASDIDIYDKASGELKAVNFTVVSGLEGVVELV